MVSPLSKVTYLGRSSRSLPSGDADGLVFRVATSRLNRCIVSITDAGGYVVNLPEL